jgi:predicted ATPase
MLRSRCSALHARAATAMVETFPEIAETQPELVAMHLGRSGQVERAIEYLLRAGRRAIERSANTEAIGQLRHAIDLLQTLPESPERAARALPLEVALGQAMIASYGYAHPGTREVLLRAYTRIDTATASKQKFAILYQLWAFYYVGGDVKLQREASAEFLQLAEASCDDGMLCVAHRIVGTTLMNMGEFAIARVHLEKAQDCYNPARHALLRFEFAQDIGATAACYLTWALWHLGHLAESRVCARAAVANTRELNHPLTLAYTLCHVQAMMDIFRQDDSAARMHAGSVIALADEHGFPFWAAGGRIIDGWAAARQGKADEGLRLLREGIAAWRRTGSKVWLPYFLALEASAHGEAGRLTAAHQTIEEALALADETGEAWAVPEMLRIRAAILVRAEETGEAQTLLQEAILSARAKQARWWELLIATDLAALLHASGRTAEAEALLAPVLEYFPEHEDEPEVQRAAGLLNEIGRGATGAA